jgi:hypothetical protein
MIYHARKQGWLTIDATPDVMVVHQNHDYSHLPGGKPHYDHEETHQNITLARSLENRYTGYMILDANRELRGGKIVRPRPNIVRVIRHFELTIMPHTQQGPRWLLTRWLRRLRRKLAAG